MLRFDDITIAGPEINHARDRRKALLSVYKDQLNAYHSPYFDSMAGGGAEEAPENIYFEYLALMLPRLAFASPTVTVESNRMGPFEMIAKGQKHAVNRWAKDVRYQRLMAESCADFLFNFSVLHVSMVENPLLGGDQDQLNPLWPEVNRISQRKYFCDASAEGPDKKRFEGHDTYLDKEDLIAIAREEGEKEGWYLDVIEGLAEGEAEETEYREGAPVRNQVMVTEVWVAGYTEDGWPGPKKGYHGGVFVYGSSPDSEGEYMELIKKPAPFYGPVHGPYHVEFGYPVPDKPIGVSTLTANQGQIEQMNKYARAVDRGAEDFKNFVVVDSTDPNFPDKVKNIDHHGVLALAGMDKNKIAQVSVGGVSPEQIALRNDKKASVDRLVGISEAMRGVAAGNATATESNLAGQGSNVRTAWQQSRFVGLHESALTAVSWYIYHSKRFKISLGLSAARDMGEPLDQPMTYQGGPMATDFDDKDASFADLELKIELFSTQHISDEERSQREQMGSQFLAMKAQTAPQAPFINHEEDIRLYGEAIGLPRLADRWNQPMYEAYAAFLLQNQIDTTQQQPQDVTVQPNSSAPRLALPTPSTGGKGAAPTLEALPGQSSGAQAQTASAPAAL